MRRLLTLLPFLILVPVVAQDLPAPPPPEREFRGAWVATVRCIDWPSKPGLPTAVQKAELLKILDKAAALRLNALMFQVRPAGDALYRSNIEPWSPWLTGEMGRAPSPLWDPLEFAVAEAHRRGLQLHAWFNPFRALAAADRFEPSAGHIVRQHKEWTARYAGDVWMNPGIPEIRQRAIDVMTDVARRYDVDGIHMDDYFYPYPDRRDDGSVVPFPDQTEYASYRAAGGDMPLLAWRRENMNGFIRDLYASVKRTKPHVAFSLSPFGYWRPGVPATIAGELDPYDDLAADVKLWLHNGWMDFLVPQLYWPIEPAKLSFRTLYDWWWTENPQRRPIYAGLAIDRVGKDRDAQEVLRQIQITRQRGPMAGHVHWNWSSLLADKDGVAGKVKTELYTTQALPPALGGGIQGNIPTLQATAVSRQIRWQLADRTRQADARWVLFQYHDGKAWTTGPLVEAGLGSAAVPDGVRSVSLRVIGPSGHAGLPVVITLP